MHLLPIILILLSLFVSLTSDASAQTLRERLRRRAEARQEAEEKEAEEEKKREEEAERERRPEVDPLASWLAHVRQNLPSDPRGFTAQSERRLAKAADSLEGWVAHVTSGDDAENLADDFRDAGRLLRTQAALELELARLFEMRTAIASLPVAERAPVARRYLAHTAEMIRLSGRVRYLVYDSLTFLADEVSYNDAVRERLVNLLVAHASDVGAAAMMDWLADPPSTSEGPVAASPSTKRNILRLARLARDADLLPAIAKFARNETTPAALKLAAAETIRTIGLPQDARADQDPALPKPAITAGELASIVQGLDPAALDAREQASRDELLSFFEQRAARGVDGEYRYGTFEVRPGDWLLMRNPSPYNLFTDLAPGIFTHVGVVAEELGADGKRRLVVVDLPEKGTHMPATNVDVFVQRTLHYVFLRHEDPQVARRMGEVAASTIGRRTEFDLTFRTDRVESLRGVTLTDQVIQTYCAGLLLLCGQETSASRSELFPVPEHAAGGLTVENLAKIGITFGDNFVSPTGALFSQRMSIVGRRPPMYDPRREVEEAVFDTFAEQMAVRPIVPSPDWFQSLRLKLAQATESNPDLASALARAVNAPKQTDLVSAAKAAAVIETLDEIAFGASGEFLAARRAVASSDLPPMEGLSAEEQAKQVELRQRHAELVTRWKAGQLSPRGLRQSLVRYYMAKGKGQLERRFFGGEGTTGK